MSDFATHLLFPGEEEYRELHDPRLPELDKFARTHVESIEADINRLKTDEASVHQSSVNAVNAANAAETALSSAQSAATAAATAYAMTQSKAQEAADKAADAQQSAYAAGSSSASAIASAAQASDLVQTASETVEQVKDSITVRILLEKGSSTAVWTVPTEGRQLLAGKKYTLTLLPNTTGTITRLAFAKSNTIASIVYDIAYSVPYVDGTPLSFEYTPTQDGITNLMILNGQRDKFDAVEITRIVNISEEVTKDSIDRALGMDVVAQVNDLQDDMTAIKNEGEFIPRTKMVWTSQPSGGAKFEAPQGATPEQMARVASLQSDMAYYSMMEYKGNEHTHDGLGYVAHDGAYMVSGICRSISIRVKPGSSYTVSCPMQGTKRVAFFKDVRPLFTARATAVYEFDDEAEHIYNAGVDDYWLVFMPMLETDIRLPLLLNEYIEASTISGDTTETIESVRAKAVSLQNDIAEQDKRINALENGNEWLLKGTITMDNAESGISVDFSGCTEMAFIGMCTSTGTCVIMCNNDYPITSAHITKNYRSFYFIAMDNLFGYGQVVSNAWTTEDHTGAAYAPVLPSHVHGEKISQINHIHITQTSLLSSCNINVYAR